MILENLLTEDLKKTVTQTKDHKIHVNFDNGVYCKYNSGVTVLYHFESLKYGVFVISKLFLPCFTAY